MTSVSGAGPTEPVNLSPRTAEFSIPPIPPIPPVQATKEASRPSQTSRSGGFTLIEILMVTVIMGLLASLAIPNYSRVTERARVARAIGDIRALGQEAMEYYLTNDAYPSDLGGINRAGLTDPWGNPYQYLVIGGGKGKGGYRKDKFLVPINSDFDLYSMGPDGASVGPLNAKQSRDDIIRANDGGFVGVAEAF